METIVPGIMGKVKTGSIASRPLKNKGIRRNTKFDKFESYVMDGYSGKKAAELAGYSEIVQKQKVAMLLRKVNWDKAHLGLKPTAIHGNHMAMRVAMDAMSLPRVHIKERMYAAKLALDNAKIHLADDKSPTNITFNFQTVAEKVQVNVGKPTEAIEDAPGKEISHEGVGEDT